MNRQEGAGGLLGRAPRSPVVPGVVQRNTLDCCCRYKKGWSVGGYCDGAEKHTGLDGLRCGGFFEEEFCFVASIQ